MYFNSLFLCFLNIKIVFRRINIHGNSDIIISEDTILINLDCRSKIAIVDIAYQSDITLDRLPVSHDVIIAVNSIVETAGRRRIRSLGDLPSKRSAPVACATRIPKVQRNISATLPVLKDISWYAETDTAFGKFLCLRCVELEVDLKSCSVNITAGRRRADQVSVIVIVVTGVHRAVPAQFVVNKRLYDLIIRHLDPVFLKVSDLNNQGLYCIKRLKAVEFPVFFLLLDADQFVGIIFFSRFPFHGSDLGHCLLDVQGCKKLGKKNAFLSADRICVFPILKVNCEDDECGETVHVKRYRAVRHIQARVLSDRRYDDTVPAARCLYCFFEFFRRAGGEAHLFRIDGSTADSSLNCLFFIKDMGHADFCLVFQIQAADGDLYAQLLGLPGLSLRVPDRDVIGKYGRLALFVESLSDFFHGAVAQLCEDKICAFGEHSFRSHRETARLCLYRAFFQFGFFLFLYGICRAFGTGLFRSSCFLRRQCAFSFAAVPGIFIPCCSICVTVVSGTAFHCIRFGRHLRGIL